MMRGVCGMHRCMRHTAYALLLFFASLVAGELAGVRVHHDAVVEVFSAPSAAVVRELDPTDPDVPCKSDESPIEHALHFGCADTAPLDDIHTFSSAALPPYDPTTGIMPVTARDSLPGLDVHDPTRFSPGTPAGRAPPSSNS